MIRYILESKPATRTVKLTLDYPTSSLCNNAGKMTLIDKVRQRIHALNNVWKICDKRSEIFFPISSIHAREGGLGGLDPPESEIP